MLPVTQIDTFYNGLTLKHRNTINAAARGTFMKRHPEECYDLIENMTAYHNDWDTSAQHTTIGQTQNVYAVGAYQDGGGFDHVKLLGRIGSFLGCFFEDYDFLVFCFGYGCSDSDCYGFDFG
nr:reverse transcriptase domain-containing protein [Tanacetum cinerariifolium]